MSMDVWVWTPGVRTHGFSIGVRPPSLTTHTPSVHVLGSAQGTPHPPQLFGSELSSTHPVGLGQQLRPVVQAGPVLHSVEGVQTLSMHLSPRGQTVPQLL